MTSLARSNGFTGALFDVSGTVANNSTWVEDIYFSEAGTPTDISGLSWKMTFRSDPRSTSAEFSLTTSDSLSVEDDADGYHRILRINVTAGNLSNYVGDYIADLASQDVDGVVTLWAHGIITFARNPVSFG